MKNLSIALAAAALTASPAATAADYADTKIGAWSIGGSNGACVAALRQGDIFLMLASADGDNNGLLFISHGAIRDGSLDPASLQPLALFVDGAEIAGEGAPSTDPRGYFFAYDMYSQMAKLGDAPRVVVTSAGKRIVDVTLSNTRQVVGELLRCDAIVS